ncbi:hypothetical protein PYCH_01790 [Pyrococcus yayanosii CH1]|uniref:Uncharacterized protein n=1 Tax=Pyrococcus yayanosii (strain CH1 / JCM 16557) TaxID=529709 RepID=F8AFY2_PYRYC|nr:hypothetical protein PYCH_01790 [Pyrococcus yayanosii CH1]
MPLENERSVSLANERPLYWKPTDLENLEVFGGLYGIKNARKRVGTPEKAWP